MADAETTNNHAVVVDPAAVAQIKARHRPRRPGAGDELRRQRAARRRGVRRPRPRADPQQGDGRYREGAARLIEKAAASIRPRSAKAASCSGRCRPTRAGCASSSASSKLWPARSNASSSTSTSTATRSYCAATSRCSTTCMKRPSDRCNSSRRTSVPARSLARISEAEARMDQLTGELRTALIRAPA